MSRTGFQARKRVGTLATLAVAALPALVGCTVDVGGQTLPSPYWLTDDVQYFAPGTEFKLPREAAAMQAAEADAAAAGVPVGPMPGPMPGGVGAPVPMAPPFAP
jgi:hypothetical protein